MHIKIRQKELDAAVSVACSLSQKANSAMPIMGNVLIETGGSVGVQLRGSDSESCVAVNAAAHPIRPGRTTVPADVFSQLVQNLPVEEDVTIEEIDGKVLVLCGSNRYQLMTQPAEDFPTWMAEPPLTRFTIAQKALKAMIEATTYALPVKDHRRVLMGICAELDDNNTWRFTATDGKQLARYAITVPEVDGASRSTIIIPRRLAETVGKHLGDEGPVDIEISARQIAFRFGNVLFRGMGIDGKYPDCDQVIPRDFPTVFPLNATLFRQAARRAGVTTDEKTRSVALKFENGRAEFSSMAHDLGTFSGSIPVEYTGPTLELAFNYQFLIETLDRFSSDQVMIHVKTSKQPVVFKIPNDDKRLALLMPIKLSDVRPPAAGSGDGGTDE
jgi:DNA polymerase-3 subunit beta